MKESLAYRSLCTAIVGAACFVLWTGSAAAIAVTSTGGPSDGQTFVPIQAYVNREFDGALSGATINVNNVTLKTNTGNAQGGAPTGDNLCTQLKIFVTASPKEMVVCEHASLTSNTWYTFTLTTGIKNSANDASLAANSTYAFQTSSFSGGGNFIPPPVVQGSIPRAGATLPTNAKIRVFFSPGGTGTGSTMNTSAIAASGSVMHPSNIQLFAASNGQPTGSNKLVCGTIGYDPATPTDCNMAFTKTGAILTITPGKKAPAGSSDSTGGTGLTSGNGYILIIKGPTGGFGGQGGVRNTNNMALMGRDYFVPFTATAADSTGPSLSGTYPKDAQTAIDRATYAISIGFNESVDPFSVSGSSVLLWRDGGNSAFGTDDTLITGTTVAYDAPSNSALLSPNVLLAESTLYFVQITSGIEDLAGNEFDSDTATAGNQNKVISFTTGTTINGAASDSTLPSISFANGDNFSIAVTFTEPMQFNPIANTRKSSSLGAYDANNIRNWTVESPPGVAMNLAGKPIEYVPGQRTVIISGLTMPPNQEFKVKVATSTGAVYVKDLSGNLMKTTGTPPGNTAVGTVRSSMDTGGQLGPGQSSGQFDFGSNGVRPVMVMPLTPIAGKVSNYRVELSVDRSIPTSGTIVLTLPSGFTTNATCPTALTTHENADINGPMANTVTISSIACDSGARTVTVTTAGGQTGSQATLRFMLQGIINSTVPKDFNTSGYSVDIRTKNAGGSSLDSKTSMPFFLNTAGTNSILGTVFRDSGAGGGTASDGIKNGSETGVRSVTVCLGGSMGSSCASTTATGAYVFDSLSNGSYKVMLPPMGSGSIFPSISSKDVAISNGSKSGVDFPVGVATSTIDVTINGIPANTDLDVFAFNPGSTQAGNIVRNVAYTAASTTVTLPAISGNWKVGVGPKMNRDPSQAGNTIPTFSFMPPQPKDVAVPTAGSVAVTFNLQSAAQRIKGKVVDTTGHGLSNAFVAARPFLMTDKIGSEGMGQTDASGNFSIAIASGSYALQAFMPGMPPSNILPVLVKTNSSNADNNTDADVYVNGTLITNAGASGSVLNLWPVISKGGLSIAGSVLDESNNGIPYAHVRGKLRGSNQSFNGVFRDAPTSSAGSYTLYVENGTWDIDAFAPGYGQLPSITVTVAGSSLTGKNITASTSDFGTISGKVTRNGTGVQSAFVNAYTTTGGNSTVSGSGGVYSMKVKAGTYTVEGFIPGNGPTSKLTGVAVTAGNTASDKNLTVGAAGTILVKISNVTDAFVRAEDSTGAGNGTSTASGSSAYYLSLPVGTYTVRANSQRMGLIGAETAVAVTAGQTTTVTLSPPTTYAVTGAVTSSSTNCVQDVAATFADGTNGRVTMTTTNAAGAYSIHLPNGSYRLSATKPGCMDNNFSTITVAGAALSVATRSLEAATLTITGKVTLDGAAITLSTYVTGTKDGQILFAEVSSGSYTLYVTSGTWSIKARSDGYESTAVTVAAGATQNLTLSAISGYTRVDPLSSQITPTAGGIVKDPNIGSAFSINLPAGALGNGSTANSITTQPTTAFVGATAAATVVGSTAVEISPEDENGNAISSLDEAATVTIPYTEADVTAAGTTEDKLVLATWNSATGNWDSLASTVDTTNNTITASIEHFSTVATTTAAGSTGSSGGSSGGTSGGTSDGGGGTSGGGGGRRTLPVSQSTVIFTTKGTTTAAPHAASYVFTKTELEKAGTYLRASIGGNIVTFRDVSLSTWFSPYVATLLQSGIASGYKDINGRPTGQFGPERNITYGEIAKMALEAADQVTAGGWPRNPSAKTHWSAAYILLMEEKGVSVYAKFPDVTLPATRGAVIQTLMETLQVTEQQPVAMTVTATGSSVLATGSGSLTTGSGSTAVQAGTGSLLTGSGTVAPVAPPATVLPDVRFKDVSSSSRFSDAILLFAKLGIVSGDTDAKGNLTGKFRPNAPINRAEVAKIFTKLIEKRYVR